MWKWPTWVTINDLEWNPREQPVLTNAAATAFLDATADLGSCEIIERTGRDLCFVETLPSQVIVHFADNPNEASLYTLTMGFRKRTSANTPAQQ